MIIPSLCLKLFAMLVDNKTKAVHNSIVFPGPVEIRIYLYWLALSHSILVSPCSLRKVDRGVRDMTYHMQMNIGVVGGVKVGA